MFLKTKEISEGRSCVTQNVEMEEYHVKKASLKGKVKCKAEIDRIENGIYVHIHYNAVTAQECARCLKNFELGIKGDYHITLQESKKSSDKKNDGTDFFFNDEEDVIDTRTVLYEEIMTSIPIKPLCRINCPGITGKKDENITEDIDPRWAKLKKLR